MIIILVTNCLLCKFVSNKAESSRMEYQIVDVLCYPLYQCRDYTIKKDNSVSFHSQVYVLTGIKKHTFCIMKKYVFSLRHVNINCIGSKRCKVKTVNPSALQRAPIV